jgi:hypothetical protein
MENQDMLIQYVRDPRTNKRRGVVLAVKLITPHGLFRPVVMMGWSYTNIKAGDAFDKHRGVTIALGRAANGTAGTVPYAARKIWARMADRASKYFKTNVVI